MESPVAMEELMKLISPVLLMIDYEIRGSSVHIEFKTNPERIVVLGSASNPIILNTHDRIRKLPHDLVQACLIGIPEGRRVSGLTPDVVTDSGIIEVVTRQSRSIEHLERAVGEKVIKYGHLNQPLLVIGVNPVSVLSSHTQLTPDQEQLILRAYLTGVSILNEYKALNGSPLEGDDIYFEVPRHDRVVESQFFWNEKIPKINVTDPYTYHTERTGVEPVSHLPMIIPIEDSEVDFDTHDPLSWFLFECIMKSTKRSDLSLTMLEILHHDTSYRKKDRGAPDVVKISLDRSMEIKFASRGVNAKHYRNNQEIKSKRLRSKIPIDPSCETGDISDYLGTPISFRMEPYPLDPVDQIEGNWKLNPMVDIVHWTQSQEFHALSTLDKIMYEVALNSHRNVRRGEFIVKKVPNSPVYVILKPTRYAGNDNPPCHVAVVYKGRQYLGPFQDSTHLGNGWYYHEWFSVDRQKMSHLRHCQFQFLAFLSTLKEIGIDLTVSKFMLLHFLVEDRATTTYLQSLRYYYMELYSGSHKDASLKVLNKMPEIMRSRLHAYLHQSWLRIHKGLSVRQAYTITIDDPEDLDLEQVNYSMAPVQTPMGFKIKDSSSFLLACYIGYCVNRDKGEMGHDSKAILSKMMKREYEYRDNVPKLVSPDPQTLFQFNTGAVALGVNMLKRRVHVDRHELLNSMSTTLSSCLSTKSSNVESCEEIPKDLRGYDKRSKVFLELSRVNYNSHRLIECYKEILREARQRPNVSLFRKNQIGGLREIFILSLPFRLMCRIVEDISRHFCSLHESEMLTKDKKKTMFVSNHMRQVKQMRSLYTTTFRWSGDMSSWAPSLLNDYFKSMYSALLPDSCEDIYNLICEVLEIHSTKKMYLPRSALKSFTVESELYDPGVNRLKNEVIKSNRPYFTMHTNMMQGILHFTSSLYHLCLMEMFREKIREQFADCELCMNFQVSSDDEGVMLTIGHNNKEVLVENARVMQNKFMVIKNTVDHLFGVRTSWEKSTFTNRDIYEFNSKFTFGNEVSSPLIKYTLRSLYDHPSESLHTRVASLYSQVSDVRSQGGSGYLCSTIEHLQNLCIKSNMGSACTWWPDFNEFYSDRCLLSFLGRHWVSPPTISGFVTTNFHDYRVCKVSEESRLLYSSIGVRSGLAYYEEMDVMQRFTLFPRKVYLSRLSKYGLPKTLYIDREDWNLILRKKPQNFLEFQTLLKAYASNPGLAKSFAPLTRSDITRASVYLAYTPIFGRKGDRTHSLREVFDLVGEAIPIQDLFPSHKDFERLMFMSRVKYSVVPIPKPLPFRLHRVFPFGSSEDVVGMWRPTLLYHWFGEPCRVDADVMMKRLMGLFPWIRSTPEESLAHSPFESFTEMVAFMETWSRGVKIKTILCKGRGGGVMDVGQLLSLNTVYGHRLVLSQSADIDEHYDDTFEFESRFSSWEILLSHASPRDTTHLSKVMEEDIARISKDHEWDLLSTNYANRHRSSFTLAMLVLNGSLSFQEYLKLHRGKLNVYLKPQEFDGSTYYGPGEMILKRRDILAVVGVHDTTVTRLSTSNVPVWKDILKAMGLKVTDETLIIHRLELPEVHCHGITYNKGLRLRLNNGYSQVFSSPSQVGQNRYPYTGNRLLEKWLQLRDFNRGELRAICKSNTPVSRALISAIRSSLQQKRLPNPKPLMNIMSEDNFEDFALNLFQEIGEAPIEERFEGMRFEDVIVETALMSMRPSIVEEHVTYYSHRTLRQLSSLVPDMMYDGSVRSHFYDIIDSDAHQVDDLVMDF
jgi:hypothetical protein